MFLRRFKYSRQLKIKKTTEEISFYQWSKHQVYNCNGTKLKNPKTPLGTSLSPSKLPNGAFILILE